MAVQRLSIDPSGPPLPRARGRIVAKGLAKRVQAVAPAGGGRVAIAYHEGFADSPGGVIVLSWPDLAVKASATGLFGPLEVSGQPWIAAGPLWRGRQASSRLIDPETLEVVNRLPLCAPFARRDGRLVLAHTPVRAAGTIDGVFRELADYEVDPAEVREGNLVLPDRPGLVELDLGDRRLDVLVGSDPFDPFTLLVLASDLATAYAASNAGRIVAVDLERRAVRWERRWPRDAALLFLYAIAIDPAGARIAVAGRGTDIDLLVLDSSSGRTVREVATCRLLDGALVTRRPNARVEALAYHPSGWLAIATSAGAIAELREDGSLTAFRAANAGIDAIAFVDGGSALLVGGREPQLRLWPVDIP